MALDSADAAEAAALVVAGRDIKAAGELLEQAAAIRATGKAGGSSGMLQSKAEGIAEWEHAHGGSMSDPAVREKVYRAIDESRKLEAAEAEKAARSKMAAEAGTQKLKHRRRR